MTADSLVPERAGPLARPAIEPGVADDAHHPDVGEFAPTEDRDETVALLIGRAVLRLVEVAARDEVVRVGLEALARSVLGRPEPEPPATPARPEAEEPSATDDPHSAVVDEIVPMDRASFLALVDRAMRGIDASELGTVAESLAPTPMIMTAEAPAPRIPSKQSEPTPADPDAVLARVVDRSRLKAALAHHAATQARTGEAIDETFVRRARSAGCSLWIVDLAGPEPDALDLLATCLEAVADATELVRLLRQADHLDRERFESAVRALAAVQSSLRVVVAGLRRQPDEEQLAIFGWLKATTFDERMFVERHMRLNDPLDPTYVPEVIAPVRAELASIHEEVGRREAFGDGLHQVRYHATRIVKKKGTEHDLDKIVEAVCSLADDGLPPSNLQLRGLLMPILDQLPDPEGLPASYARVVADLELNRDRKHGEPAASATRTRALSDEVRQVAALLRGTEMVVIGGERRVEAERALTDAFGLAELTWFTLSDDPTMAELERAISKPAVSVVVQLIRWTRHRHGDAAELADAHGKPFVRVPAGYNPNAIARAIVEQASARLRAGRKAAAR